MVRIDPAVLNGTVTVDVALDALPPKGARPDLTVDGTITLERLDDVLHVGRPVNGQGDGLVGLFKVTSMEENGLRACGCKLGRTFRLQCGDQFKAWRQDDQIILSDMSQYDGHERVQT